MSIPYRKPHFSLWFYYLTFNEFYHIIFNESQNNNYNNRRNVRVMINRQILIYLLAISLCTYTVSVYAEDKNATPEQDLKKTSMNWPDIDGAIGYMIQVTDVNYKPVFKKRVIPSNIEFALPAGEYRVRIGVINKFHKVATWSDWAVFKAKGKAPKKKKKESAVPDESIKIAIGLPYFQILSDHTDFFNDSFYGGTVCAGSRISNLIPFLHYTPFHYLGLELEATYIRFEGKDIPNRIKTNKIDIITGSNLYFSTDFKIPVNILLRGGAGLIQTTFEYDSTLAEDLKKYQDRALTSMDFYYKTGISIEYRFLKRFYVEMGADYYNFKYISADFQSVRYYFMAGIMI